MFLFAKRSENALVGGVEQGRTHGYACEGACCHILEEGKVGWEGFIAAVKDGLKSARDEHVSTR